MLLAVTNLSEVQTGTVTAVVVVTVHVEDLLALNGEQARQDTFSETSAEHDNLVQAHQLGQSARRRGPHARRILHPWLAVVCVCV